jgi:hypothetical protein
LLHWLPWYLVVHHSPNPTFPPWPKQQSICVSIAAWSTI